MKTIIPSDPPEIKAEKQRLGLIYGLLGALAFSITTWGYDAFLLARDSAGLPWLKLALGLPACLLIAGLVAWLTARLDSSLLGLAGWLVAGIVFAWLASQLPFSWLPKAIAVLDPNLREMIEYPLPDTLQGSRFVIYGFTLIAVAVVGVLETNIVESARGSSSMLMRAVTLGICIPILGLAGIFADEVNQQLRQPIQATHELIQNGRHAATNPVSSREAVQMHLGALAEIKDWIGSGYRLYIGSYDQTYLDSFNILINFDGRWASCTVTITSPGVCKPLNTAAVSAPAQSPSAQSPETIALGGTQPAQQGPATGSSGEAPTDELVRDEPLVAVLPRVRSGLPDLNHIPHYTISLTVDFDNHTFQGMEHVDYTNDENSSLDRLYFRLIPNGKGSYGDGSLTVTSVLLDGQTAQSELSLTDSVLEIRFPSILEPGQTAGLDLEFVGVVPLDFGGSVTPAGYGIYNLTDNVLALADWYPILAVYDDQGWNLDPVSDIGDSVYSDMAFYSVALSVPSDLVVAATGVAADPQVSNGEARYQFSSGPARDFFIIMSPNFEMKSQDVNGTTVNSYYLPGNEYGGSTTLDVAVGSLKIYSQKFGLYPYTELDVVDAPMRNASGVEFPGIVLIGDSLYYDPLKPAFTITVAHEVGHQWWYNVVGNDIFDEPWLDEALATFSSNLYYEFTYGKNATSGLIAYWQNGYDQLKQMGKDDAVTGTLAHFESLNDPHVYAVVVYSKGALFLNALRNEIGDQAFFEALQNYYKTYQYRFATRSGLLNAFDQASGRNLDDFYQKWLYAPNP